MSRSRKDEAAAEAIKAAIGKLYGPAIDEIEVHAGQNHSDEPMFFVTAYMRSAGHRMTGSDLLDAITAAATALRELDDDRFPYVTFLEPDIRGQNNARPAA